MRASLFPATLVALATLICLAPSGMSQEGGRPPAAAGIPKAAAPAPNGTNVAVIDVSFVFKNHTRFNAQMKQMEQDLEEFRAWGQTKEKGLQEMAEGLKRYNAGTDEYRREEEKIANESTQLRLELGRKQQELQNREAAVYYDTYAEMEKTIALVAQKNRIGIVFRFSRDPMKRDNRQSVLQGINRAVVYHYGLDITKFILDEMNAGQTVSAPGNGTGSVSPARTGTAPSTTKSR